MTDHRDVKSIDGSVSYNPGDNLHGPSVNQSRTNYRQVHKRRIPPNLGVRPILSTELHQRCAYSSAAVQQAILLNIITALCSIRLTVPVGPDPVAHTALVEALFLG